MRTLGGSIEAKNQKRNKKNPLIYTTNAYMYVHTTAQDNVLDIKFSASYIKALVSTAHYLLCNGLTDNQKSRLSL